MYAVHDLYTVLGVSPDSSDDEIRMAYRKLAMRYHPDRNLDNPGVAEKQFKHIKTAYETLADPDLRAAYEQTVGAAGSNVSPSAETPASGEDVVCEVELPLETAAFGGRLEVKTKVNRLCGSCQGQGADHERRRGCADCEGKGWTYVGFRRASCAACSGTGELAMNCRRCRGTGLTRRLRTAVVGVPAGVVEGMSIRVPHAGSDSPQGGLPGLLFCKVRIAPHPRYRVSEQDLEADLKIDFVTAVLGGKLAVETLWGTVTLPVPELTRAGDSLRVSEHGLPDRASGKKGDLILKAVIDLPQDLKKLTAFQRTGLRMWF